MQLIEHIVLFVLLSIVAIWSVAQAFNKKSSKERRYKYLVVCWIIAAIATLDFWALIYIYAIKPHLDR